MRSLFLFSALVLSISAAEIGLDRLPWTDAAYCWHADGSRLPQINRNHSGKGLISIAGEKFQRGICGHTPFSIVYDLDRKATAFSAMIGIDDERHQRDKEEPTDVNFLVLADRKVVFCKRMKAGQSPMYIKIDLRGVHQLELRAEYGTGFKLQRVAWVNPVFYSDSTEQLRLTLKRAAEKHQRNLKFSPVYPDAPDWKSCSIRKIVWNSFFNAYHISTLKYEMIIVPEFGGRIMEFRKPGGESLVKDTFVSPPRSIIRGLAPDSGGGHFMRMLPSGKFYPNDPILKYGKFRIEFPADGKLIMTSAESSLQKVIYEYSIFLKPEHVEIVNRIYNTAPFERSLAVWSITRLETAALSQIRIPPERSDPPEKLRFFSRGNIALMKKENNAILLNPTIARSSKMDVAELRCWSMTNEIVSKDKSGNSLTIRYQDSSGDLYGEYPVHVFLNQRFTEIESHSEYLMLNPGEAVLLREVWNVH